MSQGKREIRNRQKKQNYKNFGYGENGKCDLKNSETFFGNSGEFSKRFFFNLENLNESFVTYSGNFFENFKKICAKFKKLWKFFLISINL